MRIEVTRTPEGVVVRRIYVSGESAWRRDTGGSWSYCADHKGPWVGVDDVPPMIHTALGNFLLDEERSAPEIGRGLDNYERRFLLACCGIERFELPESHREEAAAAFARFRRLGLIERDPRAEAVEVMQPSSLGRAVANGLQNAATTCCARRTLETRQRHRS